MGIVLRRSPPDLERFNTFETEIEEKWE